MTIRIALVAGEDSGDLLGAGLINALKQHFPTAEFFGIAGPRMIAAGCEALFPAEKLAVMGLTEVIGHLPELLTIRKELVRRLRAAPPDVFIGIDAPDFNLGLECQLKASGIATVHYVSPSVWAWRQYRLRKIAQSVDLMLTLFPFEARFYEAHRIPVRYVGQPLAPAVPITVVQGRAQAARTAADAAMVASGTATLEAMLLKCPLVMAYRLAPFTYWLAKRLVKVPYYSLPNLLAGRALVPELIQEAATPANVAAAVLELLSDPPGRAQLTAPFAGSHDTLRQNADAHAAAAVAVMVMRRRGGLLPAS